MRPMQVSAMRPRGANVAAVRRSAGAIVAATALSLVAGPSALAAAPAPCGGVAQISDASRDGHHPNTDLLSAWFSEQAGGLQAVIKVSLGSWASAHDPSFDTAGFAILFEVAGQRRYVRVEAPPTSGPQSGPIRYDHGTWTLAGGFVSEGPTTGEVTTGSGGTATIDVPSATVMPGAILARPFVLTYDGMTTPTDPHWVDRAPGGVTPTEEAFGADYVVGSCQASAPGAPGAPGAPSADAGDTPAGGSAATTTAVVLTTPTRLVGAGRVRASGRVVPARGGVIVRVTDKARHSRKAASVRSVTTRADGSFAVSIPLSESSAVTAVAEGINAQTRLVTVRSTVRLRLRRLPGGKAVASGLVSPRLPGRVLLLRGNAVVPSATTSARQGRFRFLARRLVRGRYQAVFIPSGNRAERSTSRSGVLR